MSDGALTRIFRALHEADVRYLVVGGVAVVFHGHPRFTADLDLVVDLEEKNASAAIRALAGLGFRPRAPVPAADFADAKTRRGWIDDKGLIVFSLWSPKHPGTEVDLFVEEPFDFAVAWSNRVDASLDDGTTVRVVGIDHLRELKRKAGRAKDISDLQELDAIARANLSTDDDGP